MLTSSDFRVLSYSHFPDARAWISDKLVDDWMSYIADVDLSDVPVMSAVNCVGRSFVRPSGSLRYKGNSVILKSSFPPPTYIAVGSKKDILKRAIKSMYESLLVDIFALESGELIVDKFCFFLLDEGEIGRHINLDEFWELVMENR